MWSSLSFTAALGLGALVVTCGGRHHIPVSLCIPASASANAGDLHFPRVSPISSTLHAPWPDFSLCSGLKRLNLLMTEWTPAWEAFNTPENYFYGLLSPEQLVEVCGEGEYGRLPKSPRPMDVILLAQGTLQVWLRLRMWRWSWVIWVDPEYNHKYLKTFFLYNCTSYSLKDYFTLLVIANYWLHSLWCTVHPCWRQDGDRNQGGDGDGDDEGAAAVTGTASPPRAGVVLTHFTWGNTVCCQAKRSRCRISD